jgi:hypothetical protein
LRWVRFSGENAAIFITRLRQVADRIQSNLRWNAVSCKDHALQAPVLNEVKSMYFSSFMALKHIPMGVRGKLKRGTMKNIAAIVRFG